MTPSVESLLAMMSQQQQQMLAQYGAAYGGVIPMFPTGTGSPMIQPPALQAAPGFSLGPTPEWLGGLGSLMQTGMMFAAPAIQSHFGSQGYVAGQIFGTFNLHESLRSRQQFEAISELMANLRHQDVMAMARPMAGVMALAKGGFVDAREMADLQAQAGGMAAQGINMASGFLSMMAATPEGLASLTSMPGVNRIFGAQLAAAQVYMGTRTAVANRQLGLGMDDVTNLTVAMSEYFTPDGVEDARRTRGFSMAELGSVFSEGARRGLIPTDVTVPSILTAAAPELSVAVRRGAIDRTITRVAEYTKAVDALRDMFAPGTGIDKLYDALEQFAGQSLRRISPERAENIVHQARETMRVTGLNLNTYSETLQHVQQYGRALGLSGGAIPNITNQALLMQRAYMNATQGRENETVMSDREAAQSAIDVMVGGATSTIGTTMANLMYYRRTFGQLPPELESALNDMLSGDPSRQSRVSQLFSNQGLVAQKLAAATGMSPASAALMVADRTIGSTMMKEPDFVNAVSGMQLGHILTTFSSPLSPVRVAAADVATRLGLDVNPAQLTRDLALAYNQGRSPQAAITSVNQELAMQTYGRSFEQLSADEQARIRQAAANFIPVMHTAVTNMPGGASRFFMLGPPDGEMGQSQAVLQRERNLGAAFRQMYGDFGIGRNDMFSRLLGALSSADPNAGLQPIFGALLGQTPASEFLAAANDSELSRAVRELGITSTDAGGRRRGRLDIAYEMASRIEEGLASTDPAVRQQAEAWRKRYMSGGASDLLLTTGMMRRLEAELAAEPSETRRQQIVAAYKTHGENLRRLGVNTEALPRGIRARQAADAAQAEVGQFITNLSLPVDLEALIGETRKTAGVLLDADGQLNQALASQLDPKTAKRANELYAELSRLTLDIERQWKRGELVNDSQAYTAIQEKTLELFKELNLDPAIHSGTTLDELRRVSQAERDALEKGMGLLGPSLLTRPTAEDSRTPDGSDRGPPRVQEVRVLNWPKQLTEAALLEAAGTGLD